MKTRMLVTVAMITALTALNAKADEEQKLKRSEVPAAVIKAVSAKYPKAKMTGFSRETEDGVTKYEVQLQLDGANADVDVSPQGKILEEERTIPFDSLPPAVKKGFASSHYAKGKVEKVEKSTKFGNTVEISYELLVRLGDKTHELLFSPAGKRIQGEDEK
ncbi:MAG TPA: PepSY-like domain-containing protein, partial [Polyangiaceae bacterium]